MPRQKQPKCEVCKRVKCKCEHESESESEMEGGFLGAIGRAASRVLPKALPKVLPKAAPRALPRSYDQFLRDVATSAKPALLRRAYTSNPISALNILGVGLGVGLPIYQIVQDKIDRANAQFQMAQQNAETQAEIDKAKKEYDAAIAAAAKEAADAKKAYEDQAKKDQAELDAFYKKQEEDAKKAQQEQEALFAMLLGSQMPAAAPKPPAAAPKPPAAAPKPPAAAPKPPAAAPKPPAAAPKPSTRGSGKEAPRYNRVGLTPITDTDMGLKFAPRFVDKKTGQHYDFVDNKYIPVAAGAPRKKKTKSISHAPILPGPAPRPDPVPTRRPKPMPLPSPVRRPEPGRRQGYGSPQISLDDPVVIERLKAIGLM